MNLGADGIDAIRRDAKDTVFAWDDAGQTGVLPQDFPMAGTPDVTHALVRPAAETRDGITYPAAVTIPADPGERYGWPGLTLQPIPITDWSGYQSLALCIRNPAEVDIEIAVKAFDRDRDCWYRYFTIPAATASGIVIPIAELRQKINPAEVLAIGFNRRKVDAARVYVMSDLYLLK